MKVLSMAAVFAGVFVLAFPMGSDSCGIAPPVPVFSTKQRPANLSSEFVKGKVGVIRPTYGRSYLIGAYRTLSGKPLSQPEAEAVYLNTSHVHMGIDGSASTVWKQVQARVTGTGGPVFFDIFKSKSGNGLSVYYPNCLDSAFDTAVATFQKRAALWGEKDPRLREWVVAQDQVFQNCGGDKAVIPPEPLPGMDPLLAADRRYQIAAAHFYAADWAEAREAFRQVAGEQSSPWKGIAPYLIARTFIREGSVDEKPEVLRQAEKQLEAILNDPAQEAWHEPSRKMLDYVRLRIDPSSRLTELSAELMGSKPATDLAQSAADFLYLYRRQAEKGGDAAATLAASSDLADWMLDFEGRTKDAGPHALEQWKKTRSPAWLTAALLHGRDEEAGRAARRTDPEAPEYEAVTYYGILTESDRDEARRWADEALARPLLLSSRNLILSERLKLARDWSEFLRFAPRKPEPKVEDYDGREDDAEKPPVSTGTASLLDRDAAEILNRHVPLSLWEDASRNPLLQPHLQLQIAEAAWVRAVVLGKHAEARKLMERVVQLRPASAAASRDFLAASDPDAARFAAVFLLLRATSVTPYVEAGSAADDLAQISRLGSIQWGFGQPCQGADPGSPQATPSFLHAAQLAENDTDWKLLAREAASGASYLAGQTLVWGRSHPEDARLPEALHLIVQAGRRACRDGSTIDYGRQAFTLLHRRYPDSEWAAKTKYWYH